ncbi:ABC transporter permease [Paenibacillus septentrionalis]|uniref:ABC transporter permease n=1 Tax=Paenibacillus septentrionalis TaxID=429342 RepID=A0ABW1V5Z5_9BACL
MKLWNLALSYMKGSKSSVISLFFMILIASILLNVSLTLVFKMNTFFDEKFEQLDEPYIIILLNRSNEQPDYYNYIEQDSRVSEAEREAVIWSPNATFAYGDTDMSSGVVVQQAELDRQFSPIHLVEQLPGPTYTNGIYAPYSFKLNAGYQLGDSFALHIDDRQYDYTIIGFFESAMMGVPNTGIMKFFMPEQDFRELEKHEAVAGLLYSVKLQDSGQINTFTNEFYQEFPDPPGMSSATPLFAGLDSEIVKSVGAMTINIITLILIAFAIVIITVALIVIQFRVSNTITEGLNNIGVLKALGYTSYQVILSMLLQFVVIASCAGMLGTAASYLILPVFGSVVTTLSGLIWNSSFLPLVNLISIAVILLLIAAVVGFSALRIFRMAPVVALRGGIVTHSFKKNRVPLDSKGPLQLLLAGKTSFMNVKQNVIISIIVAAITFASIFAVVLYYNIAKEKKAFIHLVGAETSNIMLQITDSGKAERIRLELEQMEPVTKVAVLDMTSMKIDGQRFYMNISDDYSKMNNQLVYEGRYPVYDNEVAVSWIVADLLGKDIGDTVEIDAGHEASSFLITGLSQSITNLGQMTYMTVEGAKQLLPDYEGTLLNLYTEDVDNTSLIAQLKAQYGSEIANVTNVTDTIQSQSQIYTTAVFTVMVTVLAITVLVVVLILYLVIKKMILQRKKEFGVLRAMGYTSGQLMSQISLSFLPVVIVSVWVGGVLGVLYTNPLLAVLLSGAGIRNVQFIINIPLIVLICITLVLFSYIICLCVSSGIKQITTRRLMIEQ